MTSEMSSAQLKDAFAAFTASSARLQHRYESMRAEAEQLKSLLAQKDLEVKRAEKLALLGETAAALAHEIRNPLGAIKLYCSMLKQDVIDLPESMTLVQNLEHSIDSLDHVVTNILHFARNTDAELVPVNINAIVASEIEYLKSLHQWSKVTFNCDVASSGFVRGNEHMLRQMLHNILMNAGQAMKYRGQISIQSQRTQEGLRLLIRDSGPGICSEVLSQMFDPFVTSRSEGTGLGLAIVKKILNQHSGTIIGRNAPHGGAEFEIFIPNLPSKLVVETV